MHEDKKLHDLKQEFAEGFAAVFTTDVAGDLAEGIWRMVNALEALKNLPMDQK